MPLPLEPAGPVAEAAPTGGTAAAARAAAGRGPVLPPRVVLVHAVPVAVPPVLAAFRTSWPEAEVESLLDEGLTPALRREGGLTPGLVARICDLATYAARTGAEAILFTCSAFTPAIDVAKRLVAVPVLKPDEAMYAAALDAGRRVGILATMPAAVPAAEAQILAAAAERGALVEVRTATVPEAFAALDAGDADAHDRLVAEAARRLAGEVEVLCLAQFSMAPARAAAQAGLRVPVLSGPDAAVRRLKALVSGSRR
jgi:Asp/Glu/hydantoin racemase